MTECSPIVAIDLVVDNNISHDHSKLRAENTAKIRASKPICVHQALMTNSVARLLYVKVQGVDNTIIQA